jgi:transcriptional regulator of acetoin/glycerol metabolism
MGSAARELGIERTNLYRKIKQLGIRWEGEQE